jgi:hypothetical protein
MSREPTPQLSDLPWQLFIVDPAASFNRTEHNVDNFKDVGVWSNTRHLAERVDMEWSIETTSTTTDHQFLSNAATQLTPPSPGHTPPPGQMQTSFRDFSSNYTFPAPSGAFDAQIPAGIPCKVMPPGSPAPTLFEFGW